METALLKTFFTVTIFAAAWLGGWLPRTLETRGAGEQIMRLGNALAAGIFLGTGLIHMLGEAHNEWVDLGWTFPMASVLAAGGFMLLLLFEHVLLPQSVHSVVHAHSGEAFGDATSSSLASGALPYALLLALSVHSVIAGIALGAESALPSAWFIFAAIFAHKASAALALGISFHRSGVAAQRVRKLLLLFALTTPAGIVAGATIAALLRTPSSRHFDAVFLALAGGTFIYIAAVDILQDEFLQAGSRLAKWSVAALGVALTAIVSIWV